MGRVFVIAYWLGIVACSYVGYLKAKEAKKMLLICLESSFLCTFGGGLIRDLVLLNHRPVVLDLYLDVSVALIISLLIYLMDRIVNEKLPFGAMNKLIDILDSIGLGAFVCCGIDNAINSQASQWICVLCGISTSLGGGFLATRFVQGKTVKAFLTSSKRYKGVAILCTITYIIEMKINMPKNEARLIIIAESLLVYTVITNSIILHITTAMISPVIQRILFTQLAPALLNRRFIINLQGLRNVQMKTSMIEKYYRAIVCQLIRRYIPRLIRKRSYIMAHSV